mmetsp:Transcript_104108/g.333827  ORF Transcript_104108/g.333827 Transcript_104108/m.333827 type:complete len:213 (+) Transcript_104108:1656-2294(+)
MLVAFATHQEILNLIELNLTTFHSETELDSLAVEPAHLGCVVELRVRLILPVKVDVGLHREPEDHAHFCKGPRQQPAKRQRELPREHALAGQQAHALVAEAGAGVGSTSRGGNIPHARRSAIHIPRLRRTHAARCHSGTAGGRRCRKTANHLWSLGLDEQFCRGDSDAHPTRVRSHSRLQLVAQATAIHLQFSDDRATGEPLRELRSGKLPS